MSFVLKIRVVGRGCGKCGQVLVVVQSAVDNLGITASIRKVTAQTEMDKYDLDQFPGLVINNRIVCQGRVPLDGEVLNWLIEALEAI